MTWVRIPAGASFCRRRRAIDFPVRSAIFRIRLRFVRPLDPLTRRCDHGQREVVGKNIVYSRWGSLDAASALQLYVL